MERIDEITIRGIQEMFHQKKISVTELVAEYLKRISLYDQGVGKLNSIIELNPEVHSIAKQLEEHRLEYSSELYGIPILLKDNIDTADAMHTSAGSLALAKSIAVADADIVKTLREKGAVILGKTNMTEYANYMTKGMKPGYSSRGGEVRSPYKKEGDPSGSSTGSAVAVSANLCAASIGTDTSGSIVSPAKANGIVGFRPAIGSLSQKGIIPICFTLDTAGPMTRTVMDSVILYSELRNIHSRMNEIKINEIKINEIKIKQVNIKEVVVGVDQVALENLSKEEEKKAATVIKELEKAGATLKRIRIPHISKNKLKEIQRYEFKYSINRYLEHLPKEMPIHSLKDIIEFNNINQDRTLKYGQTLLLDAEENTKGDLSEIAYKKAMQDREETKKEVLNRLSNVDVCIQFQENLILQYVGLPSMTIPLGLYNNGMPNGIFLTAQNDAALLKYAQIIEQLIGRRVPPKLSLN